VGYERIVKQKIIWVIKLTKNQKIIAIKETLSSYNIPAISQQFNIITVKKCRL
jgi:hypothetical protein